MKKFIGILFAAIAAVASANAQTKTPPRPAHAKTAAAKAVPAKFGVGKGEVSGCTYTNRSLRFSVTFPDTWLIPGDDFEAQMKKKGFDLSLKAPVSVGPQSRAKLDQALKKVNVLLNAYRSMPGSVDNAIVRISAEDLESTPQIKDAVDYFDAMRSQFKSMTLPPDFKYSETQAEQLGPKQFAYLDSSSKAGKKRLYATVRNGYAILFSLSYNSDDDLRTMRQILSDGDFAL